jgi:hypothetical protein
VGIVQEIHANDVLTPFQWVYVCDDVMGCQGQHRNAAIALQHISGQGQRRRQGAIGLSIQRVGITTPDRMGGLALLTQPMGVDDVDDGATAAERQQEGNGGEH